MQERPDSALVLLERIDPSSLHSRYGKARYALRYSQALDKNYIDVDKDTLISQALTYYQRRGCRQDQALAYYYYGRVYENAGNVDSAIIRYTNVEELLHVAPDVTLQGLTASALARLYEIQNFIDAAKDKYLEAADYFSQAGLMHNVLISYTRVLGMLSLQNDFEQHEQYYRRAIDLAKQFGDTTLLIDLEQSNADRIINQYADYRRALNILKRAANNYNEGKIPSNYYFIVSNIYVRLNRPDSALLYIEPLVARMQNEPLRVQMEYAYMVGELYKAQNDFATALQYNNLALRLCDSLYFIEKEHTIPELQAKYRTNQLAILNKYLKSLNRYQLYIAVIALISLLFGSMWLIGRRQKRIQQQQQEISEYQDVITRLKDEYEELRASNPGREGNEMINRRISFLKQLLETTVQYGHDKDAFYNKIGQLLSKNSSNQRLKRGGVNEILLIFQDILNAKHPGIIDYLCRKYPQISNQELSLYCMVAMDISKTAICLVMNTSPKTYYNYRNMLRNKLNITNDEMTIPRHYRMICEEFDKKAGK